MTFCNHLIKVALIDRVPLLILGRPILIINNKGPIWFIIYVFVLARVGEGGRLMGDFSTHFVFLETAYFTSKPILLTKNIENKVRSKVNFPQCLVCDYMCLSVCLSVCVSVCPGATAYTVWARDLKFGHSTLLVTLKKWNFLFFEILIFTLFIGIFVFFSYITLVKGK